MSTTLQIDAARVTQAILSCDVMPTARELAAPLVEAYLDRLHTFPEISYQITAVERPWNVWIDKHTLLVGVNDVEMEDSEGRTLLCEWKTRRAPKLKRDGTPYAGDDEDGWLEEISNGPQLAIYAASKPGSRIMVRAAIKSTPVAFWPVTFEKGVFEFPQAYLWNVQAALVSKAAQIRAARKGPQPYQLTGTHCTNMYRRVCEFKESVCDKLAYPIVEASIFDPENPAFKALIEIDDPVRLQDPELVILSASGYQDACQCIQRHHLVNGGFYPKQAAIELEIGTVYHAALASIYTQLMERQ